MVDLAKIRKKAKKSASPPAGEPAEPFRGPVAEPAIRASVSNASPTTPAVPGGPDLPAAPSTPPPLDDAPTAHPAVPAPGDEVTRTKLDRFKEQAGRRRETKVEVVETTGEKELELLTFAIAGELYAVDIERIVEIVTPRPVTRIPNADPTVLGITSLRGTIVTLVDVRRKLRHAPLHTAGEDTRIVVIELQRETVGFTVDRVVRVVKIAPAEVEAHPVVHSTELEEAIRGVFRTAGALTILLDLDKLLDHS